MCLWFIKSLIYTNILFCVNYKFDNSLYSGFLFKRLRRISLFMCTCSFEGSDLGTMDCWYRLQFCSISVLIFSCNKALMSTLAFNFGEFLSSYFVSWIIICHMFMLNFSATNKFFYLKNSSIPDGFVRCVELNRLVSLNVMQKLTTLMVSYYKKNFVWNN